MRGKAGWCRKQQQCSPDTLGLILRFSANPRDGATWWARAAAARGKLAMVLPRERAAAAAAALRARLDAKVGGGTRGLPPPGTPRLGEAQRTTQHPPPPHH